MDTRSPPGIGLAANQIGLSMRLAVVDVQQKTSRPLVLINPQIIESHGHIYSEEGCLSVPGFYEPVVRAERISVKAFSPLGEPLSFDADGLLAVCIQHECDHLEGKLFVDYLSNLKRNRIRKKLEKLQKKRA